MNPWNGIEIREIPKHTQIPVKIKKKTALFVSDIIRLWKFYNFGADSVYEEKGW